MHINILALVCVQKLHVSTKFEVSSINKGLKVLVYFVRVVLLIDTMCMYMQANAHTCTVLINMHVQR